MKQIDTGYRDLAGKPIFVGSVLSNPSHERCFDVYPGVVKIDADGEFYVSCQSTKNKKGGSSYSLRKSTVCDVLVIS